MARLTGLEPATPGVTGRYSNRLSYNRASLGGHGSALRSGGIGRDVAGVKRFPGAAREIFPRQTVAQPVTDLPRNLAADVMLSTCPSR